MKEIKFYHPACDYLADPLKDFDPSLGHYYPKGAGLYIYGIRTKVDGIMKFIPLAVGESKNLRRRLYNDHYESKFAKTLKKLLGIGDSASDPKELWEFSKDSYNEQHIQAIYNEMKIYDTKKKTPAHLAKLNNLLFFQNAAFFHKKLEIQEYPWMIDLTQYWQSVEYLLRLSSEQENKMKIINYITKIIATFDNFSRNFYFVYAQDENFNVASYRRKAEFDIKNHLSKLGIHTTAKGENMDEVPKFSINFSEIQNELVILSNNVINHPDYYKEDKNNYIDNLIIPLAIQDEKQ
jgi:hypothetical protein